MPSNKTLAVNHLLCLIVNPQQTVIYTSKQKKNIIRVLPYFNKINFFEKQSKKKASLSLKLLIETRKRRQKRGTTANGNLSDSRLVTIFLLNKYYSETVSLAFVCRCFFGLLAIFGLAAVARLVGEQTTSATLCRHRQFIERKAAVPLCVVFRR